MFKSEVHSIFTEKVVKISSSFNDVKRSQSINRVKSYPNGKSVRKSIQRRIIRTC